VIEPIILENLGSILSCFGEIQFERNWGERVPEDTEEEKRAK